LTTNGNIIANGSTTFNGDIYLDGPDGNVDKTIYYKTTHNHNTPILKICEQATDNKTNNGHGVGLFLGGNGTTAVLAGEGIDKLPSTIGNNDEKLLLVSDTNVELYTNSDQN
jgi:hypothetical protein